MRLLARAFAVLQFVFAVRVLARMAKSANGARIEPSERSFEDRVTVIVPVLNEERRLAPCLEGLIAQGSEVGEILVVDGGSCDGTRAVVLRFVERDARIRFIDAGEAPAGNNGKAHNLRSGYRETSASSEWILTVDADVRPKAGLTAALLATAKREQVSVLSAATTQRVSDPVDAMIHPSMLTTLVYRFGIPGHATGDPQQVQANGQCMLIAREALERVGGFDRVQATICEDVTLARALASAGVQVGFYEAGDLIEVEMYASWRETWANWSRSLPMRDRYSGSSVWTGLAEVTLVQALPLWLAIAGRSAFGPRHPLTLLNGGLLIARLGVLAGTRRAYRQPPAAYWLSPLADLPVALKLWRMAATRQHMWRGRPIHREESI